MLWTYYQVLLIGRCFGLFMLSQRHAYRFYTPIATNLIASENRKRLSPPIDADTLGDFFRRSRRCCSFENSCDKIAHPDELALQAIRSNDRRKSRRERHTWRMPVNLIADSGDRRKLKSLLLWRSAYKISKCVAGFTVRLFPVSFAY